MALGEQIISLVQEMTDKLDNRFPPRMVNNMPDSPMVIIYTGETALRARSSIMEAFSNVWRKRAKAIAHLIYSDGSLSRIDNESDEKEELEYGLGDVIDELQESVDSFRNMAGLLICTVENTEDFKNAEEVSVFEEDLREIIEDAETSNYNLARFVLLNESARERRKAREIRDYIKESKARENNEALILISNKLRDNSKIQSRSPVNYQLIGSAMLIINGANETAENGKGIIFRDVEDKVLTASYSRIRRPNRRIIETILLTAVSWLRENQQRGAALDYNELCIRFRLSGGHMEVIDKFYEDHIKGLLPPTEVLEYFPRKSNKMSRLSGMPFAEFQKETFEIYSAFIDRLIVFDKNTMNLFRKTFRELLEKKISTTEAACSLTDTNIESIINELRSTQRLSDKLPAGQFMAEQIKQAYTERVCAICREEMREYYREARNRETMLDDIIIEIQNNMITNPGDHVQQYYEELTLKFLAGEEGRKFLGEYRECSGDTEEFLNAVKSLFDSLFTKESVFSLPLEGELAKRLGDADENYQRILQNELMKDIEQKARLKTVLPISARGKVIMANRKNERGADTDISEFLMSLLNSSVGDVYFDTGDSNLIETVVFYAVNAADL